MAKAILVLKVNTGRTRYEVYTLNVGDTLTPFGGSRSGLQARKTASIVVREISSMGLRDTEYDIHSRSVWGWIETLIRGGGQGTTARLEAECPLPHPEDASDLLKSE